MNQLPPIPPASVPLVNNLSMETTDGPLRWFPLREQQSLKSWWKWASIRNQCCWNKIGQTQWVIVRSKKTYSMESQKKTILFLVMAIKSFRFIFIYKPNTTEHAAHYGTMLLWAVTINGFDSPQKWMWAITNLAWYYIECQTSCEHQHYTSQFSWKLVYQDIAGKCSSSLQSLCYLLLVNIYILIIYNTPFVK
jgi:hypothetical protein